MRSLLADFICDEIAMKVYSREMYVWRIRKAHNNLHAFRARFKLFDF